jgi:peroxiredoxin
MSNPKQKIMKLKNNMEKLFTLLLLFSAYFSYGQKNTARIPRVNDQATDFTVQMVNGETITLSDLKGQVVLLNFFGLRCAPCIKELRAFPSEIIEPFKDNNFVLLPISTGATTEQTKERMVELSVNFNVGIDPKRAIFQLYVARSGIPQNFVIDKNGVIRYASIGYTEKQMAQMASMIEKILNE